MADDDATPRGARSTARGSRSPAKRATTEPAGPAAKKAAAKKAASKRSTAAPAGRAPAAPAKKAVTKKAATKKAVTAATKAPSSGGKRTADAAAAKRPAAPRRKAGGGGAVLSESSRPGPGPSPVAAPVADDPVARRRALLRATAARLEHRDVDTAPPPPPSPIALPVEEPEPVTEEFPADELDMDRVEEAEVEQAEVDEAEVHDGAVPVEAEAPPEAAAPPPVATAPPSPPSPPPPSPSAPTEVPVQPEAAKERRGGGAGLSVLAIVLAVVVPVVGAVVALVLAGRARRRDLPLAGVARIVAVVALLGWVLGIGGGVALNRNQGVDYSKLKVGDCFDSSSSNQVRGVKVKPCSKAHDSEVFFLVTHPAGKAEPYPGKDALVQFAADSCLGQPLTQYLGVPLEQSKLKDFEIVPQASAWKDGRRLLVCGLDTGGQGRITGSVKGSRR